MRDGQVTEKGLVALRSEMPYADLSELDRDRRLDKVTDLFTVDLLVRYVSWKLENDPRSAHDTRDAVLVAPQPIGR